MSGRCYIDQNLHMAVNDDEQKIECPLCELHFFTHSITIHTSRSILIWHNPSKTLCLCLLLSIMDLGLADAEPARQVRQRRGKSETEKEVQLQLLLQVMARLSLSNAQSVRALRAITIQVYRIQSNTAYVKAANEDIKTYLEKSKEITEKDTVNEKLGTMGVHVFNTFLKASVANKETEIQTYVPGIGSYIASHNGKDTKSLMAELAAQVRHIKVAKHFKGNYKKLEVSIMNSQADQVFQQNILPMLKITPEFK